MNGNVVMKLRPESEDERAREQASASTPASFFSSPCASRGIEGHPADHGPHEESQHAGQRTRKPKKRRESQPQYTATRGSPPRHSCASKRRSRRGARPTTHTPMSSSGNVAQGVTKTIAATRRPVRATEACRRTRELRRPFRPLAGTSRDGRGLAERADPLSRRPRLRRKPGLPGVHRSRQKYRRAIGDVPAGKLPFDRARSEI